MSLSSQHVLTLFSPTLPSLLIKVFLLQMLEDTSKLEDQRFISVNDTDYLTKQITCGQTRKGMDTEEPEYKANDRISFNDVEDEPKKNRKKRKKGMVKTTNRKGTSDDGFQLNYPEA
uniref:Uncharacterized protein n=1 Tax=Micrurus corallinus TaxID=54390 RepID=A0A2D4GX82_MICCO